MTKYPKPMFFTTVTLIPVLIGCSTTQINQPSFSETKTLQPEKTITNIRASQIEQVSGELTLSNALALALAKNPELETYSWETRMAEARGLQARLRPNPVISLTPEDITGSGNFSNGGNSQTTLQLSQVIELGGKRAARIDVASSQTSLAELDYEIKRINVFASANIAFIRVLEAQEQVNLAQDSLKFTEEVLDTAMTRFKVGAIHEEEVTKAEVDVANARIHLEMKQRLLTVARKRLADTWGESIPLFTKAIGTLERVSSIPSYETLLAQLSNNPEIQRWSASIVHQTDLLKLEKANAIPDVTIGAGYRRIVPEDANTLVLGLSIPLPFSNRNQGRIAEAETQILKTRAAQRATELRIQSSLYQAHQSLLSALSQVSSLKEQVLPGAESVLETVTEHYLSGRYTYVEIVEARRTLFSARHQLLQSLADYHVALVELERLIGTPVTTNFSQNAQGNIQ